MPSKPALYTTAAVTVIALLASSLVRGVGPESLTDWLTPIGPGVAVSLALLAIFDHWAWKWRIVRPLHRRPVLHGTWHGELASDWEDHSGMRIPPDPNVFLVIRQRFWQVTARLLTKESSSVSFLAEIEPHPDGVCQLIYVYRNTPRAEFRPRSELHYGTVILSAPRDRADGLVGDYFTDRKTRGDMRFHAHFTKLAETHAAALRLLDESSN